MGIRLCPKCNGKVSTSRNDCIHCGYVFPSSKKCPDCGEAVYINVMECPVCGYLFNKKSSVNETLNDIKETAIEEQKKTKVAEPETVVPTDEISTETEENNLEIEKEIVVEEHNETSEVVEEDTTVNDNNIIAPVDDSIPTIAEEKTEEENTKSSAECPYCGSKSLMSIGIEYYMCDTCKGRFLNTKGGRFDSPNVENLKVYEPVNTIKSVGEVSNNKNTIGEFHNNIQVQSKVSDVIETDTTSKIFQKSTFDEKYYSNPKFRKKKVSSTGRSIKKIWIIIGSIVAGLMIILSILTGTVFVPKSNYDNAMSFLKDSSYYDDGKNIDKAIEIFDDCSWADSKNQALFARARKCFKTTNFYAVSQYRNTIDEGFEYMHDGNGEVYVRYNTGEGSYGSIPIDLYSNYISYIPFKEGYTFAGWYIDSYNFFANNYGVELFLKAKWSEE